MAGLLIFSSAGGLLPRVILSLEGRGWNLSAVVVWGAGVFDTFNTSIIVWGAWASACYLALSADDRDRVRPLDIAVACGTFVIAAFPAAPFSWLALSLFSSYVYLNSPRKSTLRRRAIIFFVFCFPMLLGAELMCFVASLLLLFD